MRLIVNAEDDVGVVDEAIGKLCPKLLELFSGSCIGVSSVADDLLIKIQWVTF